MRRLIVTFVLELYALALAWLQALGGLRTDEAKYLLNIPYPHPPLARFLLSLTEAVPFQETLWRIVIATLIVQAAWLVWDMARGLTSDQRSTLAVAWLFSAAIVLQAGSIMMAPLTALQGLLFVWLYVRASRRKAPWKPWQSCGIALLWLVSLLTAYQSVLYFPLVLALLRRGKLSLWQQILYFCGPPILTFFFIVADPRLVASIVSIGGDSVKISLEQRAINLFQAWSIGGSVILGIIGLVGMIQDRAWALLLSTALAAVFVFGWFHLYFAILFTPLFTGGTLLFFRHLWHRPGPLLPVLAILTFLCVMLFPPAILPTPAHGVMQAVAPREGKGVVLVAGSFGHEWQYESLVPLRRYRVSLLKNAQAVICLTACREVRWRADFRRLSDIPVEVWVRR